VERVGRLDASQRATFMGRACPISTLPNADREYRRSPGRWRVARGHRRLVLANASALMDVRSPILPPTDLGRAGVRRAIPAVMHLAECPSVPAQINANEPAIGDVAG
jgi:hypothetical protein